MGKAGQSRQAKFGENREKGKRSPSDTFYPSHKVQKYIQKCLKIAPGVIKINSIPT
jgi:hypothetical protein